jgi:hypothetical protein
MNNSTFFYEKQYFRQWWVIAIVLASCGPIFVGLVMQVFLGITFGDKPIGNDGLIVLSAVTAGFCYLMFSCNLRTTINGKGITLKFWPFHIKPKFYAWQDIAAAEVKIYNPFGDYGGWGIKPGAYNVKGNVGLLLTFTNGNTLMIGTQQPEELKKVLSALKGK